MAEEAKEDVAEKSMHIARKFSQEIMFERASAKATSEKRLFREDGDKETGLRIAMQLVGARAEANHLANHHYEDGETEGRRVSELEAAQEAARQASTELILQKYTRGQKFSVDCTAIADELEAFVMEHDGNMAILAERMNEQFDKQHEQFMKDSR